MDKRRMPGHMASLAAALALAAFMGGAAAGAPDTASAAAFRRLVDSFAAGKPDYTMMSPALAQAVRQQPQVAAYVSSQGAVQSVLYLGREHGADSYSVRQNNGSTHWRFAYRDGTVVGAVVTPGP